MRLDPRGAALALGVALPLALFLGLILRPGLDTSPPGVAPSTAVRAGTARMQLRFVRESDSRIRIEDVGTGSVLRTATAEDGGFLWGILRPLDRERVRYGTPLDAPYHLVRTEGRLLLEDPSTELEVDLAAFGATSAGLFDALLTGGPAPPIPALLPSAPSMEDRP